MVAQRVEGKVGDDVGIDGAGAGVGPCGRRVGMCAAPHPLTVGAGGHYAHEAASGVEEVGGSVVGEAVDTVTSHRRTRAYVGPVEGRRSRVVAAPGPLVAHGTPIEPTDIERVVHGVVGHGVDLGAVGHAGGLCPGRGGGRICAPPQAAQRAGVEDVVGAVVGDLERNVGAGVYAHIGPGRRGGTGAVAAPHPGSPGGRVQHVVNWVVDELAYGVEPGPAPGALSRRRGRAGPGRPGCSRSMSSPGRNSRTQTITAILLMVKRITPHPRSRQDVTCPS